MILRDFQIRSPPALLDRERELNHRLFPLYEAVRLDLRGRRPKAPFRKIVVTLVDKTRISECRVMNCLGICEVSVPVDVELVLSSDLPSLVPLVIRGLEVIASSEGFSDPAIATALTRSGISDPPCSHIFGALTKTALGHIHCETWFVARPGHSAVEVRFSAAGTIRAVKVREANGPLWIEDDFPVRASRIDNERYLLLDRERQILAEVHISPESEPG